MSQTFALPEYRSPDFNSKVFKDCPVVGFKEAEFDGVAPEHYHATSIYPEYFQIKRGEWKLAESSRMDCVVISEHGILKAVEFRHIKKGDPVIVGRTEDGEEGIYVHTTGFAPPAESREKFSFHTRRTRETPFSRDYDSIYELLKHEREMGNIVWILGPAVTFDYDSRKSMTGLIENGYVHALLAGNALAVHDIEASMFGTGLGQDIYTKEYRRLGHYHHLDAINAVRRYGSMKNVFHKGLLRDGIICSCLKKQIPFVLAGSIRDDGPLPDVIGDVYEAQDRMRAVLSKATTVIALATQLHAIASGNMLPSHQVREGVVRPVYFYIVDISEFALDKLANRGSLEVRGIVTNVQDFLINVSRALTEGSS